MPEVEIKPNIITTNYSTVWGQEQQSSWDETQKKLEISTCLKQLNCKADEIVHLGAQSTKEKIAKESTKNKVC